MNSAPAPPYGRPRSWRRQGAEPPITMPGPGSNRGDRQHRRRCGLSSSGRAPFSQCAMPAEAPSSCPPLQAFAGRQVWPAMALRKEACACSKKAVAMGILATYAGLSWHERQTEPQWRGTKGQLAMTSRALPRPNSKGWCSGNRWENEIVAHTIGTRNAIKPQSWAPFLECPLARQREAATQQFFVRAVEAHGG